MTPDQYERLTEQFHAALAMAPDERAAFLDKISESDWDSRRELEALLATYDRGPLTERPPADIAAGLFQAQQDACVSGVNRLALNTRIDRYEIRSLLGKGGMGEVYLAEDMRLHRKVALKVLPSEFLTNHDRMRRFEQEAHAAAVLNHPNIAHIYEIGAANGVNFIAMELIDGVSLRTKIYREHTELRKLLKYLQQVAEGLAKAHASGIVHRDLKPDNIMITRDDYAKILDFGLAKLIEPQGPAGPVDAASREDIAQHSWTGMVMGTAGYMSPEQAQGRVEQIDHRSDIFSFGCILFEAVTGQRPFSDESVFKSLHNVVFEAAPQVKDFNPSAPPDLQRVIRRCLAKDREDRYQTIKDVALELKEVRLDMASAAEIEGSGPISSSSETSRRQTTEQPSGSTSASEFVISSTRIHKRLAVVAALGAIAIATVVWYLPRIGARRPDSLRPVTLERLTPDIHAANPTISPNGEFLAYVNSEKGTSSIWLKHMAGGNAVQTMPPSVDGYSSLQFSPDGTQIYYMTTRPGSPNSTISRVSYFGGMPKDIASNVFGNFAISHDGKQLAFVRGEKVVIADAEGRGERDLIVLTSGSEHFLTWGSQLSWSPDGTRIAVCGKRNEHGRDHAELFEISVGNGAKRTLLETDWNVIEDAAWLSDGAHLLITAREKEGDSFQIWRVAYPGGETTRVTHDSNNYEGLSLTADSRILVAEQTFSRQNIWLATLSDTKNAKQLTSSTVAADGYSGLEFAPDQSILFTSPRSGNVDLWKMNPDGSGQQQLTANAGNVNFNPHVTPDGRYTVFVSSRTGTKHIWRMDADGRNPLPLTNGANGEDCPYLSPDGRWVYYSAFDESKTSILKVSIEGGHAVRVSGDISTWDAVPSPDGKLLACSVYADKSENPWKTAITSSESGGSPILLDIPAFRGVKRWTNDSKSIIYIKGASGELWQQSIDGRPPVKRFTLSNERLYNFTISPDFQKIAYSLGNESSEAVLVNNFETEQVQQIPKAP